MLHSNSLPGQTARRWLQAALFFVITMAPLSASASDKGFSIKNVYAIDAGHSYVGFQVKYMGFAKVRGRFESFSGSLYYDPADITRTSATIVIKTESIDTDLEWRDKDLKSANWFDAEQYPTIHFQTTRVEAAEQGTLFFGQLDMHGTEREVSLKLHENSGVLEDSRGDSQVILTGSTSINRQDFGVEGKRWSGSVADEVEIELTVLAKRINKGNFRNWVRNTERPQGRIYKLVSEAGIANGLAEFEQLRASGEGVDATVLNTVGYMLLKEGKVKQAITVFEHNLTTFPENPDLYDSLAEAFAEANDFEQAAVYFHKALEKNPQNANAAEILRHLPGRKHTTP